MDYIMDGQKGVAEFTYHHLLKDQEGKSNYLCSDPSRKFFKFLREDGEYERDQKAERLTKMIVKGNLRKQTIQKATEFWTNEVTASSQAIAPPCHGYSSARKLLRILPL